MKKYKKNMNGSFVTSLILAGVVGGLIIFFVIKAVGLVTNNQQKIYQQTYSDMQTIAAAANKYYNDHGVYPASPLESHLSAETPPIDLVPTYLSTWPKPPCQNWKYEWVKGADGTAAVVVTSSTQTLYHLCVSSTDEDACSHAAGGAATTDITNVPKKEIDCTTIILK